MKNIKEKEKILDVIEKRIFLVSIIFTIVIFIPLLVLTLTSIINYKICLAFVIGSLVGNAMYYLTIVAIKKSPVEQYKNVVSKLFALRQFIYICSLVLTYVVTKDIWAFVACLGGILINKLAIFIAMVRRKKRG